MDLLEIFGLLAFFGLILCQVKMWCLVYGTCGSIWRGIKSVFRKG